MDPLAGSPWSASGTWPGSRSPPNPVLIRSSRRPSGGVAIARGCSISAAGRAQRDPRWHGWLDCLRMDLSWRRCSGAAQRAWEDPVDGRSLIQPSPPWMDPCPGPLRRSPRRPWHLNLARSVAEFRRACLERRPEWPGRRAGLFVSHLSRTTLPPQTESRAGRALRVHPVPRGSRSASRTEDQLVRELAVVGFTPDPGVPLREHNAATAREAPHRSCASDLRRRPPLHGLTTPRGQCLRARLGDGPGASILPRSRRPDQARTPRVDRPRIVGYRRPGIRIPIPAERRSVVTGI